MKEPEIFEEVAKKSYQIKVMKEKIITLKYN